MTIHTCGIGMGESAALAYPRKVYYPKAIARFHHSFPLVIFGRPCETHLLLKHLLCTAINYKPRAELFPVEFDIEILKE